MGQGGTLPVKKTQTISLYNTTGIIEKDKNIYFSPLMKSGSATPINERWLSLFREQCPSPTDYTDITISIWSPEDRTLKVRGNIDDFRVITEHGLALNYLILKRDIYSAESVIEDSIYYAFFITDVKQAGQGSVQLTLEPDHFTNVFYLHNNDSFLEGEGYYDAFNKKLKNCYVERQHYNRVKVVYTVEEQHFDNTSTYRFHNDFLEISATKPDKDIADVNLISISINDVDYTSQYTFFNYRAVNNIIKYIFRFTGANPPSSGSLDALINVTYSSIEEDNLPIFSQIEESFKYKRQYRDYKEWLNYGEPITEEEKQVYEEAESWNDLTSEQKINALKLSTAFLHITLTDINYALGWASGDKNLPAKYIANPISKNLNSIRDNLVSVSLPIYHKLDFLEKFKDNILDIFTNHFEVEVYSKERHGIYTEITHAPIKYYVRLGSSMNDYFDQETTSKINISPYSLTESFFNSKSVFSEYVISAYVSKESPLFSKLNFYEDKVSINIDKSPYMSNDTGEPITTNTDFSPEEYKQYNLVDWYMFNFYYDFSDLNESKYVVRFLGVNENDVLSYYKVQLIDVHTEQGALIDDSHRYDWHLALRTPIEEVNFELDLSDKVENPKTNYYDPVLSFNPYSFYSISYLGNIENVLNKLNYYEKPNIDLSLFIRATDTFKASITPVYDIMGLEQKMYSESINQTLTNQVTLLSSKYADYIVANRTQMKNQFAVNDLQYKTEMLNSTIQSLGVDVPSAMARGGVYGGTSGALVGGISKGLDWGWGLLKSRINWTKDATIIDMNQKAKLADLGNMPSNVKQTGTDIEYDLSINELGFYLNHYRIDEVSYNSICKYLERFGYTVNIYDTLNVNSRVGWDYLKIISFDYEAVINVVQEESIRQIFAEGVTLLHDKSVMTSGHNYETILEEVI